MTLSILAVDKEKEQLGIAVITGSVAVGSRVPWAKAGIGVVATQGFTNPSLGPIILQMLEKGFDVKYSLKVALDRDPNSSLRQVAVLDAQGNFAVHTGKNTPDWKGHVIGENCICVGNLITGRDVLEELRNSFESTKGSLINRLLVALREAVKKGGDKRGHRSAAILVVGNTIYGNVYDRIVDIRVDLSENPINDLEKILYAIMGKSRIEL